VTPLPPWLNPAPWLTTTRDADESQVSLALRCETPSLREFAALLSEPAGNHLEDMARRAELITRQHFGKTIGLYVPLYLSNHCSGGCIYCGFASNRKQVRRMLNPNELLAELESIRHMGIEDILLLTGERTDQADFDYLAQCVGLAAQHFHKVTIESFAMSIDEYRQLVDLGCTGITLYQETYNPILYTELHKHGEKRDYAYRLETPDRAFRAGLRTVGIGALLGPGNPAYEAICLYQHIEYLRKHYWQGGVSVSFPRIRPQSGYYEAPNPVSSRYLAQLIFAFRICFPDLPLVLSTRESARFRDGMAGVGINKMSVASRTTVGGYANALPDNDQPAQFETSDSRGIAEFCTALANKHLEPVFKNWDTAYR